MALPISPASRPKFLSAFRAVDAHDAHSAGDCLSRRAVGIIHGEGVAVRHLKHVGILYRELHVLPRRPTRLLRGLMVLPHIGVALRRSAVHSAVLLELIGEPVQCVSGDSGGVRERRCSLLRLTLLLLLLLLLRGTMRLLQNGEARTHRGNPESVLEVPPLLYTARPSLLYVARLSYKNALLGRFF